MAVPGDTHLRHRLTRRGILKLGLGVGGVALFIAGIGTITVWPRAAAAGRKALSTDDEALVRALAEAWLPEGPLAASGFDITDGVDTYVSILPGTERNLLRGLLRALDQLPRLMLSSSSRLTTLPLPERIALLEKLERGGQQQRELALFLRLLIGTALFRDARAFSALGLAWGCPVIP